MVPKWRQIHEWKKNRLPSSEWKKFVKEITPFFFILKEHLWESYGLICYILLRARVIRLEPWEGAWMCDKFTKDRKKFLPAFVNAISGNIIPKRIIHSWNSLSLASIPRRRKAIVLSVSEATRKWCLANMRLWRKQFLII